MGLTGSPITTSGTLALSASSTGSGIIVLNNSPVLTTPNLGTPSVLVGTNITGTAAGLTAGTVTLNANLSGVVTSSGSNVTSFTNGSTGSGAVVLQTAPTVSTLTVSSGGIHQVAGDLVVDVGAVTLGAGSIAVTLGAITASVGDITSGVWPVAYSKISPLSIYSTGSITTIGTATHGGLQIGADASIGGRVDVLGGLFALTLNVYGGVLIEGDVVLEGALEAADISAANCTFASLECGDIAVADVECGAIECGDITCANISAATIECAVLVAGNVDAGVFIGLPL